MPVWRKWTFLSESTQLSGMRASIQLEHDWISPTVSQIYANNEKKKKGNGRAIIIAMLWTWYWSRNLSVLYPPKPHVLQCQMMASSLRQQRADKSLIFLSISCECKRKRGNVSPDFIRCLVCWFCFIYDSTLALTTRISNKRQHGLTCTVLLLKVHCTAARKRCTRLIQKWSDCDSPGLTTGQYNGQERAGTTCAPWWRSSRWSLKNKAATLPVSGQLGLQSIFILFLSLRNVNFPLPPLSYVLHRQQLSLNFFGPPPARRLSPENPRHYCTLPLPSLSHTHYHMCVRSYVRNAVLQCTSDNMCTYVKVLIVCAPSAQYRAQIIRQ